MQIPELRALVSDRLLAFAWNEWAQLGVFGETERASPWAADPEALLVFTLQVARDDPRLFDEVLDWLVTNAPLISVQRLRNETLPTDESLVEACLAWAASNGAPVRAKPPVLRAQESERVLFFQGRRPTRRDPSFATYGYLKPPSSRSRKSRAPDLMRPIALAFRLRQILGLGSRAEAIRFLLTAPGRSANSAARGFTTASIADAASFAKRNVQDALTSLALAGVIRQVPRGNEHLYSIDTDRWDAFLFGGSPPPEYRDWSQALLAMRELHRWLAENERLELSPYMLASEARRFLAGISSSLSYGGFTLPLGDHADGEAYWPVFVELVSSVVEQLVEPTVRRV